jgi:hypothetical protein
MPDYGAPPQLAPRYTSFTTKRLARQIPADTSNKLTRDFEIIAVLANISEILLAEKTPIREKHKNGFGHAPNLFFMLFLLESRKSSDG